MRGQLSNEVNRGVAQLASASGLGPEGPVFESLYPDKKDDLRVILFCFPPLSNPQKITCSFHITKFLHDSQQSLTFVKTIKTKTL